MKKLLFVALALGLSGPAVAGITRTGDVSAVQAPGAAWDQAASVAGRPYEAARSALKKSGVQPVRLKHDNSSIVCDDDFCRENPEVIDCSTDHLGDCTFAYRDTRSQTYLVVQTHGDDDLTVDDVVMADANEIARIERSQ